jgi:hypothetical protein
LQSDDACVVQHLDLVERLGGAILAPHSQSVLQVLHTVRILKERGSLHLWGVTLKFQKGGHLLIEVTYPQLT